MKGMAVSQSKVRQGLDAHASSVPSRTQRRFENTRHHARDSTLEACVPES